MTVRRNDVAHAFTSIASPMFHRKRPATTGLTTACNTATYSNRKPGERDCPKRNRDFLQLQSQQDSEIHDEIAHRGNETDERTRQREKQKGETTTSSPEVTQTENMTNQRQAASFFLLNLVAILWGSQHSVIKSVVNDIGNNASTFTLVRFGIAALLTLPYTPGIRSPWSQSTEKEDWRNDWRWGIEMGFWMFLGFSFQAIGLGYTTAQKSGFLLYLNVKFVPFFARLLLGREISATTWLSALTAFTGTGLLAFAGSSEVGGLADFNVGDAWSIAAAAASAMFILRLEKASASVSNSSGLNSTCLWMVTIYASLWTVCQGYSVSESELFMEKLSTDLSNLFSTHFLEMFYLSGVTTALANWVQTKAQRDVPAERASLIYSMDPVYGACFSYWILGETLEGPQAWLGAAMITLAAASNAFLELRRAPPEKSL